MTEHVRTFEKILAVKNYVRAGIPQQTIARLLGMSCSTLQEKYKHELSTAHAEHISKIADTAFQLAADGNEKMVSLLLKTQGARYGFVEKQVIEQQDSKAMEELASKVKALEKDAEADY